MPRRTSLFVASIFAVLFAASESRAGTKEIGPTDDLKAALTGLQPGDELVLKGGTYEISGYIGVTIEGMQNAPIVVRGKTGEKAHVHRALDDQNILDFVKARYVTFRDIEFSGGSRGLRLQDASFVTIEGC